MTSVVNLLNSDQNFKDYINLHINVFLLCKFAREYLVYEANLHKFINFVHNILFEEKYVTFLLLLIRFFFVLLYRFIFGDDQVLL